MVGIARPFEQRLGIEEFLQQELQIAALEERGHGFRTLVAKGLAHTCRPWRYGITHLVVRLFTRCTGCYSSKLCASRKAASCRLIKFVFPRELMCRLVDSQHYVSQCHRRCSQPAKNPGHYPPMDLQNAGDAPRASAAENRAGSSK